MERDKAKELIRRLRIYKEENDLSYDDLAYKMGVSYGNIVNWLSRDILPGKLAKKIIEEFLKDKEIRGE